MQPCSSKECRITEDQSGGLKKEMVLLDPGTHFFDSTLIYKIIFSRSANLTYSILQPFELQGCTVPQLKDLIHICLDLA